MDGTPSGPGSSADHSSGRAFLHVGERHRSLSLSLPRSDGVWVGGDSAKGGTNDFKSLCVRLRLNSDMSQVFSLFSMEFVANNRHTHTTYRRLFSLSQTFPVPQHDGNQRVLLFFSSLSYHGLGPNQLAHSSSDGAGNHDATGFAVKTKKKP